MARKVLGDDPFAAKPGAKPSKPAKSSKSPPPAKAKASKAPPPAPENVPVTENVPAPENVPEAASVPEAAQETAAVIAAAEETAAGTVGASETPDVDAQLASLIAAAQGNDALRAKLVDAVASITAPAEPPVEAAPALAITESTPPPADESGDATAMMRSDYYLRRWGRIAMRDRSEAVDDFGLDPAYEARWRPVWDFLYDRWWRVEVEGIHHVPSEGAVALVANHGGAIPFDGVMLATALRREHPAQRQLRWLADDFVFHMPFAGAYVNRIGAVRACQENAERLIRKGNAVALFPEGIKGIGKLYKDRYRLQRFGRGGHIKLAIRTRAPIVPVTILGNEDTNPMLADSGWLSKLLGVPYVPITPTFPLLGPLGLLPLPAKWRIFFGEPIPVDHLPPEAADDELLVGRLNEKLRATIQDTLDRALRERRSVFKG